MSEENDSYWIVEWRYPASLGKPASSWMPIEMTPCRYREAADRHDQRSYYEYRVSEFKRAAAHNYSVASELDADEWDAEMRAKK